MRYTWCIDDTDESSTPFLRRCFPPPWAGTGSAAGGVVRGSAPDISLSDGNASGFVAAVLDDDELAPHDRGTAGAAERPSSERFSAWRCATAWFVGRLGNWFAPSMVRAAPPDASTAELHAKIAALERAQREQAEAHAKEVAELESLVESRIFREDELETEMEQLRRERDEARQAQAPMP